MRVVLNIDVQIENISRLEGITNAPVRWDDSLECYVVNRGGQASSDYGWTPVTDDEMRELQASYYLS